jgi:phage antirepressor YoqD-like protein
MHTQPTPCNTSRTAPRFAVVQNVARRMSSRELAELTGKLHKNVKRDIAAMLSDLKVDALSFERIYLDSQNREQTEYLLDREHTDCLLTGYSAPLRMKVIRRWHELEQGAAPALPKTLPEALRLAADLAEQCNHLQAVVTEQAPQVQALARIADAAGAMCLTDAAKHLGVPRGALIDWMHANRWIYRRSGSMRWMAYQPRQQAGLLAHKLSVIGTEDDGEARIASQVRVTAKGLAVLAQKFGAAK